jgi:hypothetical protein
MRILILLVAVSAFAQVQNTTTSGFRDDSAAKWKPSFKTNVAALPSASGNTGVVYLVGTTPDCTATSGTTSSWCKSNGTTWELAGGSGPGGSLPTGVSSDGASGLTVVGNVAAASITMPAGTIYKAGGVHTTCGAITTPSAGSDTTFFDSANGDKFTRKDSSGTCQVDGGGGSSFTPSGFSGGHSGSTAFVAVEQCRDDAFTITTDFQQASQTAAVALTTLAGFADIRSVRVMEDTIVTAGGTVTGVAVSVGTSGSPSGYAGPMPLMVSSGHLQSWVGSGTVSATDSGTQALQVQLAVTGGSGNLSALTGGVIKIRTCMMVGQ